MAGTPRIFSGTLPNPVSQNIIPSQFCPEPHFFGEAEQVWVRALRELFSWPF